MTSRPPGEGQPQNEEALRVENGQLKAELIALRARFAQLQHDVRRAWGVSRGELKAGGAPRPRRNPSTNEGAFHVEE
jgi:hypothetical protein